MRDRLSFMFSKINANFTNNGEGAFPSSLSAYLFILLLITVNKRFHINITGAGAVYTFLYSENNLGMCIKILNLK